MASEPSIGTRRRHAGGRTGMQPAQPSARPVERWLFAHPSWLRWKGWVLDNLEVLAKDGRELPITGVYCVMVPQREHQHEGGNEPHLHDADDPKHLLEVRQRCVALGLRFAYGIRHSHQSFDDFDRPLQLGFHEKVVDELRETYADHFMLDMEPYYPKADAGKQRYHHQDPHGQQIVQATKAWRELGPRILSVYPAHPRFFLPSSVMEHARHGRAVVHALDHTTYNAHFAPEDTFDDLRDYMKKRNSLWVARNLIYTPGFYGTFANDASVLSLAARYERCWFFFDPTKDDLKGFGTDHWTPTRIDWLLAYRAREAAADDANCDRALLAEADTAFREGDVFRKAHKFKEAIDKYQEALAKAQAARG